MTNLADIHLQVWDEGKGGKGGGVGAVQCIHMLGVTHLVQCNGGVHLVCVLSYHPCVCVQT